MNHPSRLTNFSLRLLTRGQASLSDGSWRLQLIVFNFSLYLALLLTLFVVLVGLGTGEFALLMKLPLPALLLFIGILGIAERGSFLTARVAFVLSGLVTLTAGVFLYGKQIRLSMFCLNLALLPFLLFRAREWRWIAFCTTTAFILFQLIEYDLIPSGTHPWGKATETLVRFVFGLGAFIGVVMPSVLLLWQSNKLYRRALQHNRVQALDEKLAAIGRLAAGAAHEINNPLAIIRLTLENLEALTEQQDNRGLRFRIQKGYDAIGRIYSILQKLLTPSSAARGQPEALCVTVISEMIAQRSRRYLKSRGIELAVTLEHLEPSLIVCHPQHIIDTVDSLINNALEAMLGLEDPAVSLTISCQDRFFWIKVEDRGPGISEHIIRSIFTPFFTTKEVGSGLGLSLYSARCLARLYGGDLTCERGPGGRFALSLPLQAAVTSPA